MRGVIGLTKRNLLIYFKDVQSVIFSLLSSIIVFVLYLLFLKGTFVDSINASMQGLEGMISANDVDLLVNGILLVGILGTALITVPYNCVSTIIKDREQKIDYDILATPIKRWQIILSYFMASTISAFIISAVILTAGLITLSNLGNFQMTFQSILEAYGVVLLGAVSATAFFMIVVLFFKTTSASGAFFGILSAASGFVIGAYMPVSQFSENVQTFCNLFPASHVTILFRNVILNDLLDKINGSIGGIDGGMLVGSIKEIFTFQANLFGHSMSHVNTVWYVFSMTLVGIMVMIFAYSKTYKRK